MYNIWYFIIESIIYIYIIYMIYYKYCLYIRTPNSDIFSIYTITLQLLIIYFLNISKILDHMVSVLTNIDNKNINLYILVLISLL